MKTGRRILNGLTPSRLSLLINLPLALSGLPFGSFDAYTHIFFADHYRRAWFDLVEPKWFGGFSVASYPPLVHQLIALISRPLSMVASLWGGTAAEVRFAGEAAAYCVVLVLVLACLPLAVERFAHIFVPARAARSAGWLALGLPSVYLTAYAFGQLPTLAATTALLWALAQGWQFLQTGRLRDLLLALLWAGVTAALHHAVLLFALVIGAALSAQALLSQSSLSIENRVARLGLWAAGAAVMGVAVVWPFIAWSQGYTPQAPIDHLSRHNVLTEWLAGYYFLWPMYGPLLAVLFIVLVKLIRDARRHKCWLRYAPLLGAASILFTLGLGGTTPLPRLLFGANWEWLTYDRFSLWAGLALLPLAGWLWQVARRTRWVTALISVQVAFCVYAAVASVWVLAQPVPLDVARIAYWLDANTQGGERYITLGFGDQLAKLSVLTDARTIDGTYFTARKIDVLREGGIGTIDGVRWSLGTVWEARPFLVLSRSWGVRWVLNASPDFAPVLRASGFELRGSIVPGVSLWRQSASWVTTEFEAPVQNDALAAGWWGSAPLLVLVLALIGTLFRTYIRYWRAVTVAAFIGLWPFWYNALVWTKSVAGVYYTYTSGILFLADGIAWVLVIGALITFLQRRVTNPDAPRPRFDFKKLLNVKALLAALFILALISIPLSIDPQLSLGFVLHSLMCVAVGWATARTVQGMGWRALALALTIGLVSQSVVGLLEVAVQHTAWLEPLALPWPGSLWAETRGASVVGLANGLRWLRAYGTLPHPNMLGAYLVICLAGPLIGYLQTGKIRWLMPLVLGVAALFITFSRAAWLASGVMLVSAFVLVPVVMRRRVAVAGISAGLVVAALAVALSPLVLTRVSASGDAPREVSSTLERLGLAQVALDFIAAHPLTGVGAGTFTVAMAATAPVAEPVHNLPLLVASELGLGGGAAVVAWMVWMGWTAWRRRGLSARELILAAALLGLIVFSQFDHFMWSLSAGRVWLAVMIGLWAGCYNIPPGDEAA